MDLTRCVADVLLAATAEALISTDGEGIIRLWNPGAERLLGDCADEAIGASLDLIIPERLRARYWRGYRQLVARGKSRYGAGELLAVPVCARMRAGFHWSSPSLSSRMTQAL